LTVPWADIEQICLRRTIFRRRVTVRVSMRLAADAALLHDGPVKVPPSRVLNVGGLARANVSEGDAIRLLEQAGGMPLEVTEVDRRNPADRSRS
jgi:hypothetical protein